MKPWWERVIATHPQARPKTFTDDIWWGNLYMAWCTESPNPAWPDPLPLWTQMRRAFPYLDKPGGYCSMVADPRVNPQFFRGGHAVVRAGDEGMYPEALGWWDKWTAAYVGPFHDPVGPFLTSTVAMLLRAPDVHPPIVADALQDAGIPEDHWLLARLRDDDVPFIQNEWLQRQIT